jgi:hypothetical protein
MGLQILFKDRQIYRAPLEVLQHLYYYTTQYGLSVAQFTGAHQDFWENLPKELRKAKRSEKDLEAIIEKLEGYSKGSQLRLIKRREQKDKRWAQKEIVLNAQLISVLAAFPNDLLSLGFRELTKEDNLPKTIKIVDLVLKKEDGKDAFVFVEPDILLLGEDHLLMIEIKTRGWSKSSRKYPPSQLLNYFRLIAECQDSPDYNLPKNFSHLILVPSIDKKWLEKNSEWVVTTRDDHGRLIVDPEKCIIAGSGKTLYNHERVKNLLSEIPIYYRSWEELELSFKTAISRYNDERNYNHWQRLCEELFFLSNTAGKYK